jgi:hypothetical protein
MLNGRVASSFVIYVDEAGDEGFQFKSSGKGSSEWFVLSAVVVRKNNVPQLWENMRATKLLLERLPKHPLHFRELKHCKRLVWAQQLRKIPIKTISVLIHKPSLTKKDVFQKQYYLYRYASRFLIERCSWLCGDHVKKGVGDGMAEMIFSNRSAMSYEDMWNYWTRLKDDASISTTIAWKHLDLAKSKAINSDQDSGLQIADCVASCHYHAVAVDKWGNNEPRYFQQLLPKVYKKNDSVLKYGLKVFPALETIKPSYPHLSVFDGLN